MSTSVISILSRFVDSIPSMPITSVQSQMNRFLFFSVESIDSMTGSEQFVNRFLNNIWNEWASFASTNCRRVKWRTHGQTSGHWYGSTESITFFLLHIRSCRVLNLINFVSQILWHQWIPHKRPERTARWMANVNQDKDIYIQWIEQHI